MSLNMYVKLSCFSPKNTLKYARHSGGMGFIRFGTAKAMEQDRGKKP